MIATIPFAGFYCSIHDSEINHALESALQDENGEPTFLVNHADVDYNSVFRAYAKEYAENFGAEFDIISLKFESMGSPREYNFSTDRIFVEIDESELREMINDNFAQLAKSRLTSRSGFISYYDPDVTTWGDISTWDHNQLGILVESFVGDDFDEFGLMESSICNGFLDNLIWESMSNADRIGRVYDWLRNREESRK
jgi:hypothetical protein